MGRTEQPGTWTVLVFTVTGLRQQQRILRDFRTAAMPGITALGTQNGSDFFVVAECRTAGDESLVAHVVEHLDPGAVLVHTLGPGTGLAAAAHASTGAAAGEADPTG